MDWTLGLDADLLVRFGLCALCGGAIGLERQLRGKAAGIRTSMLIAFATMLFVRLGVEHAAGAGDPNRVLSQVVAGVGFLGAGLILARGVHITGMTSAAVVWVLAAIGCAIGLDRPGIAMTATVATLFVLVGVSRVERVYRGLRRGRHKDGEE